MIVLCSQAQEKDYLLDEVDELGKTLFNKKIDIVASEILIRNYLKKAFKSERKELIGRAYYLLSYKNVDVDLRLKYIDSALYYTQDLKDDPLFPMKAIFQKGVVLSNFHDYKGALDKYISAESLAKAKGNINYQYHVKFNIASLKRRLGDYKEAITLFKECQAFEASKENTNRLRYQNILFQLSSIYYESGELEKCSEINREGINYKVANKDVGVYYNFIVNEGINLCLKGNYKASIDSIEKGIPKLKRATHKAIAHFYLAKSYKESGQNEKALYYFKEIDSFFSDSKELFPPLRPSYEYLITDAKKKKDYKQQLYYTEQLLKLDSIIHEDHKYLANRIVRQYDIPELMESRDELIDNLEAEKKQIIFFSIAGALLILVLVVFYNRHLKKKYQQRYDAIINQSNSITEEKTITAKDVELRPVIKDIDEEIVEKILSELAVFEREKQYLTNQISLKDTAKLTNTNSKYLSRVINSYKKKNFTTYINDLRVDYLIDRIQHDPLYQKYTIRAIAEEGGFSNPEGFLRAFQKKTGLKPSYFIKKIRESKEK